jgi:hypothetical protein
MTAIPPATPTTPPLAVNPITGAPIPSAPVTVVPPATTPPAAPPVTVVPPTVVPPTVSVPSPGARADAPAEPAVPAREVRQVTLPDGTPVTTPLGAPLYVDASTLVWLPGNNVSATDANGVLNPAAGLTIVGGTVTGLPPGLQIDGQGVLLSTAAVAAAPAPETLANAWLAIHELERRLNGGAVA